jgi:predicted RNase H-like HicB family nuclease
MLVEYIQAAMNQAIIVPEMADGTYLGNIPGFVGVCATATTKDGCRANLQAALEEWVIFRTSRGLQLPNISNVTPSIPGSEINNQRLERINKLEKEIEDLRLELGGIRRPKTLRNQTYRFNEWYKNYFSLLSVVIGAIAIGVGFWLYRVNPIQKYQDNLTKEVATDYYRDLGDRFMNYGEFDGAAEVYQNALDVDKYDVRANSGLRTAQIFQPPKGDVFFRSNCYRRTHLSSSPKFRKQARIRLSSVGLRRQKLTASERLFGRHGKIRAGNQTKAFVRRWLQPVSYHPANH